MPKIIALNPANEKWYTPLAKKPKDYKSSDGIDGQWDIPEAERFSVKHRGLTLQQKAELDDSIMVSVTDETGSRSRQYIKMGTREMKVLNFCITDWKNLFDEAGKEIKFSTEKLDWIPPNYRTNIVQSILGTLEQNKKEADENLE